MGLPAIGTVILVPFPYANLSRLKNRPALVVAHAELGNVIVCQVTSKRYTSKKAIALSIKDFANGGLRVNSYARPDKLSTLESGLIIQELGTLKIESLRNVLASLKALF